MTTLFYPTKHREAQNGAGVFVKEMRLTKKSAKVYKTDDPEALIRALLLRGYPMFQHGEFEIGISTAKIHPNGTVFCDAINGRWYHDAARVLDGMRANIGEVIL